MFSTAIIPRSAHIHLWAKSDTGEPLDVVLCILSFKFTQNVEKDEHEFNEGIHFFYSMSHKLERKFVDEQDSSQKNGIEHIRLRIGDFVDSFSVQSLHVHMGTGSIGSSIVCTIRYTYIPVKQNHTRPQTI